MHNKILTFFIFLIYINISRLKIELFISMKIGVYSMFVRFNRVSLSSCKDFNFASKARQTKDLYEKSFEDIKSIYYKNIKVFDLNLVGRDLNVSFYFMIKEDR